MEKEEYNDQVEGRNAVLELLESGRDINKILVANGEKHGSIHKILAIAKERKIIVTEIEKNKLNQIAQTPNNQGVIAIVPPYDYCEVEDILDEAKRKNEKPFILILDGIEDPHNLGSIIRTAETAGVHGIIIPKRRAASVNSTVSKVSAGAVEYMKIARVNNINETIRYLKEQDVWICGTDMDTDTIYTKQDYKMPIAIVIGSEGFGMSRLVKENCDFLVKIPMKGRITSLNASVSAGIIMYEVVKNRKNALGIIGVTWLNTDLDGGTANGVDIKTKMEQLERNDTTELASEMNNNFAKDLKVVAIRRNDNPIAYKPYQYYIYTGDYPFFRSIYAISTAPSGSLANGFYSFLTSVISQKIILGTGILPAMMPQRNVALE